eukprot:scaffold1769_cov164-Ochromonas_danica.AAC.12
MVGGWTKTALIQRVLDRLYPNPPIPLNHSNGFTFLVAVVLSAQTTDGKVNEVTRELFAKADNPSSMAQLSVPEIQRIIQSVGLAPRKAQYISSLSKMLLERFNGEVPGRREDLESLPGVGGKTASVILSQLFQEPSFAVDTHVHRLALRWGLTKEAREVRKVQEDLCRAFPKDSWDRMIYFGREYCSAKGHKNSECPICSWIHQPLPRAVEEVTAAEEGKREDVYSPQKRAKGLVYYSDRLEELVSSPHLVAQPLSSHQIENLRVKLLPDLDQEVEDSKSVVKMEVNVEGKEESESKLKGKRRVNDKNDKQPARKRGRPSRSSS